MPVILALPERAPRDGFDAWCAVGPARTSLDPARRVPGLGQLLEEALDQSRDEWFALARTLGEEPSAVYAHTPSCAANVSDFGLMLAWTRLVDRFAAGPRVVRVVCDDPWLFRHFAARPGVRAGRPPPLWPAELRLLLRGILARAYVSARMFCAALRFGRRHDVSPGGAWILSYAHPGSAAGGMDAYFGELMAGIPGLRRVLHVDGPLRHTAALCGGATVSLHAFGSPAFALGLWRARWWPNIEGPNAWLVRRASVREGATGQAATIAWQVHCQERWLARAKPALVVWPWENHSWERALSRACRRAKTATVGYQHASVGAREWNHAPGSNFDGASLPDKIVCAGPAWAKRLRAFGHAQTRIIVGGAWRSTPLAPVVRDPAGAVFVALPADKWIASEMLAAIRPLAGRNFRFLVREHPMMPYPFTEAPGLARAIGPLAGLQGISAVLYAGTTVGLEAALARLPTIRFRPEGSIANDVLPEGFDLPSANADDLGRVLGCAGAPPERDSRAVFAPIDMNVWRELLRVPT